MPFSLRNENLTKTHASRKRTKEKDQASFSGGAEGWTYGDTSSVSTGVFSGIFELIEAVDCDV